MIKSSNYKKGCLTNTNTVVSIISIKYKIEEVGTMRIFVKMGFRYQINQFGSYSKDTDLNVYEAVGSI